ncbi:hypothetical protein [Alterisphingorhabdus coralli]|uniref:Uncharacterized protein n=1 Tax=Alterisphingorhabdus coralli TaxID=3071408 RepID=A0AA97F8H5_9SPHN|nr:hypothetical protein [Parasphingorhabdus sp. SCSIO 66989]WOE76394.1 hypothetical protein RB602_06685 [Parasphingorhabdus sp. SCSIO 66989]
MPEFPLTPRLAAKLSEVFAASDQQFAHEWLVTECGPNIPGGHQDLHGIERVRAAALKVSDGSLEQLARATALGQIDWRDLLMAAGFGSLDAHETWLDKRISD